MAINSMHLDRFLRLLCHDEKGLRKELLGDINTESKRAEGLKIEGGHFYSAFWADAREHINGGQHLSASTEQRIKDDPRRKNIYPLLAEGFLSLFTRFDNSELKLLDRRPKGHLEVAEINLTLKIENIMALSIREQEYLIYPYWFLEPRLLEEPARIGLWAIDNALKNESVNIIRLVDIIRGKRYAVDAYQPNGNEADLLKIRYRKIYDYWERLVEEKSDR